MTVISADSAITAQLNPYPSLRGLRGPQSVEALVADFRALRSQSEEQFHEALLRCTPQVQTSSVALNTSMRERRGVVLSDLHLLAARSDPTKCLAVLHTLLPRCGYCVLNGDIIDPGWAKTRVFDDGMKLGLHWIEQLVTRRPHCTFVYVSGNHDAVPRLHEQLRALSTKYQNFRFEPYVAKIGQQLFLHGDVVKWDRPTTEQLDKYRSFYAAERHRGALFSAITVISAKLGLHSFPFLLSSARKQVERIHHWLTSEHPELLENVTSVYFGHTHTPMLGFKHRGLTFFNTGSTEQGSKGRILRFTVNPERQQSS